VSKAESTSASGTRVRRRDTDAAGEGRELAVARQPILDHALRVAGYELLFRSSAADRADVLSSEAATSSVIVNSFMEVGLNDLVGDVRAYINVSRAFLESVRPLPLPPGRVVLELLEDQVIDDGLIAVLDELIGDGFSIALDDFVWTEDCEPLLERADIVKIDILAYNEPELAALVRRLRERPKRLRLLAEKVETRAEFERCRALGFDTFQGYFFARPARIEKRGVPTHHLAALSAMTQLASTEDFDHLERIITRDVGLSMRLLRYANSAYIYLPRRVGSVHDALMMLGTLTVRRWATMIALAGMPDAPHELLVTALVRARMCQLLSGAERETDGDEQFTVGLFSVADALVDAPMESIVEALPLKVTVVEALVNHAGRLGRLLDCVLAYERADFDAVERFDIPLSTVDAAYRRAIPWADIASGNLI